MIKPIGIVVMALLVAACSGAAASPVPSSKPSAAAPASGAAPAASSRALPPEIAALVDEARREGRVVIYGTSSTPAEEEAMPETAWRLEFLLQSTEDPSLLVPAAQVWNDEGALSRWLHRPPELLLAELGRATRTYPELGDGLRPSVRSRPRRRGSSRPGSGSTRITGPRACDRRGPA